MIEMRKKYDRIFKENAVILSYEKSNLKEFAAELGISPSLLSRWRQVYEKFGAGSFHGSGHARVHPEDRLYYDLKKKFEDSKLRFEILKNATIYLHQENSVIYQFIKENEHKYSVLKMCQVLEVGYGRYHRWKKNGISLKKQYIDSLKKDITSIFFRFKKYYGRNKITKELHKRGYKISERQVSFYMMQLGLKKIIKGKFKVTTDSTHNNYTAPNILNRQFRVNEPSKVWVSDITYIQTIRGFLYLTIIMDLFDRKIVGWSISCRLFPKTTTIDAWNMAVKNRNVPNGLIFHSDRGVQYTSKAFIAELNSYNCTRSMSRKGSSIDNAVAESFFNSLKRELINRKSKLISQKKMKIEIFEFIENWYNKNRIHSALNFKTIEQFNKSCK
ncbi:IS3 family transposase [Flavobacterium mesophilum]|uniref:IS3 family transposase n=1 Tax=Flavobacterium mesophilum TaxID=3143495 RepID=UPI0031E43564